jgi:hypothetical protein
VPLTINATPYIAQSEEYDRKCHRDPVRVHREAQLPHSLIIECPMLFLIRKRCRNVVLEPRKVPLRRDGVGYEDAGGGG